MHYLWFQVHDNSNHESEEQDHHDEIHHLHGHDAQLKTADLMKIVAFVTLGIDVALFLMFLSNYFEKKIYTFCVKSFLFG